MKKLLDVMAAICLTGSQIPSTLEKYAVMGIINAVCIGYCIIQLNKRMDLRAIVRRYKNKCKKVED